ncbi:MAG: membrane protein insertase YidC, partial [Planctomycetota bacterium]
ILFAIVWSQVRVALFPPPPQPPAPAVAADDEPQDAAADAPADGETAEDERPEAVVPEHQPTTVVLGGGDVADGYFQRVTLTSAGAAVESIELLDERYCELGKPGQPLKVVGHENDREDARTLDSKLTGLSADVPAGTHWQLVATETDTEDPQINTRATFELAVDGVIARKVYMLRRGNPDARDSEADGYRLEVTLAFKNESETDRTVTYVLQGPTGLPLESLDVGRKFREIELSFVGEDGSVTNDAVMAQQATDQAARNAVAVGAPEEWRSPLRYAGTEVQYFASLLFPQRGDATAIDEPLIDAVYPVVTGVDPEGKPQRNDVSVELRSVPVDVPAGSQVAHRYTLLTAPKRPELFEPVGAGAVLDLGWFWFVSEPMLWLLEGLHSIGIPFGIAIICLTVIVRCGMMPLTLKQVRSAARMKELQPKLEELKKKHGDDREALGRAQMKLWSDEGINPLAGCLPLFVQLPIFIGLYNALN